MAGSIGRAPTGVKGPKCGRAHRRGLDTPRSASYLQGMARTLIILGVVLVAAGLLWPWLQKAGIGRLPGDILIQRDGFTLYLPITTSILISIVISVLLWLIGR